MTTPIASPPAVGLAAFRVDGRVAWVTGGAQGIGLASARLLAEAGAHVVIADRDAALLDQAVRGNPTLESLVLDVTDAAAVAAAAQGIAARHGRIDILVNNAGLSLRHATDALSLQDWNAVVGVNLTGSFLCAQAAARHMPDHAGAAIVNLASIMGLSGGGLYPNLAYQATKGGVVNMTRALAVEWAARGIRVNAVAPTWTDTAFIGQLKAQPALMDRIRAVTPLGRLAQPHEVAHAVLFLASAAAAMVTGHVLAVDGGYLAQ